METKHTQGQWVVDKYNNIQSNGKTIKIDGSISMVNFGNEEEKANTHLIAAAPELLEQLQNMINAFEEYAEMAQYKSGLFMAKEAIRKATNL
jgi:hypothetical protein